MEKFYFGAALAAHQCEGNNINSDWWKFEQEVQAKKGQDVSGEATRHATLFEQDFEIAKSLNFNAHRLSIEWAKIEPKQGEINQEAINFYKNIFASLKKNGLTPFVTLWHFSLPQWFAEKGGFQKKENIIHYANYCKLIAETFRDEIEFYCTINEPEVYIYHSYLIGLWPPLQKKFSNFNNLLKNLAEAHIQVYKIIKAVNPSAKVGVAKNNQVFKASREKNIFDRLMTKYLSHNWNEKFLDQVIGNLDFIGLNYYFFRCVETSLKYMSSFCNTSFPTTRRTDMDWEVYPEGLYIMSKELHMRYNLPIIITENGVADREDKLRGDIIKEGLEWLFKARSEGVNIFGYLHWALTDNFEWDKGFSPRFGLVEINYSDYSRKIRPSALVYKNLIEEYNKKYKLNQ